MRKGIPAALMRFFTRTRRVAIVGAGTEKARPTCSAVKPSTVLSISGVASRGSIAGCAQTSISSSRRSGIASTSTPSMCASGAPATASSGAARCTRADFHWSRSRLRATVSSHASGCQAPPAPATSAGPARTRRRARPPPRRGPRGGRQQGEQPAVAVPGRHARRSGRPEPRPGPPAGAGSAAAAGRQRVHAPSTKAVAVGRTSITPHWAPGHFSAQPMAASRSGPRP